MLMSEPARADPGARCDGLEPRFGQILINQEHSYPYVLPLVVRRHHDRVLARGEGFANSHGDCRAAHTTAKTT